MPDHEALNADERVSNVVDVDAQEEQPETGGDAVGAAGDIEAVEGYERPRAPAMEFVPEFAPEGAGGAAVADPVLALPLPDIGAASFGGFAPETVHGADDRRQITATDRYPWRVHASLIITAADNTRWIGTAWFVNRRVLITAGHCVHIKHSGVPGQDGWVSRIRVIPGRNGTQRPLGEHTATEFHSVRGWTDQGDPEYDYGAIVLSEPADPGIGWFGFGRYPDHELVDVVGNISGYPGDKPPGTQWYAARRIDSVTPRKVNYDIDTAGGQSGAAVYRIKDNGRFAIAIHAYGGARVNSGTRINRPVFDNIRHWRDANPNP